MRVRSVTLSGFGALSGRFELDGAMTVVSGPNESGKSTLHTALRLALCGLDLPPRGRMPKETEEVLRRFRPWRGGPFQVEAEVELEGGRYRFVRDLERPDSAQVFDLTKGGEVTQNFRRGRNVEIAVGLGMGRDAFLAVSTVAQDQLLRLGGQALRDDLQRASSTSGSDATARSAIDRLERWRTDRIRGERTSSRPLDRLYEKLNEARHKLDGALELRQLLSDDLASKEALEAQLAHAELLVHSTEVAWKTEELSELQQDLGALAEIDQELSAKPEPRLPKDPQVLRNAATGARGLAQQWQEAEGKVSAMPTSDPDLEKLSRTAGQGELAFLVTALEQPLPPLPPSSDIPDRLQLLDHRRISFNRWSSDLLAILGGALGVLLIALGVVAGGVSRIALVVVGAVVLVITATIFQALQRRLRRLLAVGGFTSMRQMRRASHTVDPDLAQKVAAREKVQAEQGQAQKRLAELGLARADLRRLKALSEQLPQAQAAIQERQSWETTAKRFRQELVDRARRVGISGNDPLQLAQELGSRLRQLDEAEDLQRSRADLQARRTERLGGRDERALARRAEELSRELVALEATRSTSARKVSSEELRHRYDEAVAGRDEINGQLLPLRGRLQERLRDAGDVAAQEELVANLNDEVGRMTRAEAACKLAISELQRAEGLVHNDLAPRLAQGVQDWLPKLTQGRYQQAWVDPSDLTMHVAAQSSGVQIQVQDLSQGTREQIYLALRAVLARALSPKGEPVPLFFDDPCVSADDERCRALLQTLAELAKATQVVVFSHESRVASWAAKAKVPILSMEVVPATWSVDQGDAQVAQEA